MRTTLRVSIIFFVNKKLRELTNFWATKGMTMSFNKHCPIALENYFKRNYIFNQLLLCEFDDLIPGHLDN